MTVSVGLVGVPFEATPGTAALAAQAPAPIQTQETNLASIVAEFVECRRSVGVLSVRVRLRNTAATEVQVRIIQSRNWDQSYVTADAKKYLVLRDSEDTPLTPGADAGGSLVVTIPGNGSWTWWAKYPAPPASVQTIDYMTPLMPPFEDVPMSDR